MKKIFLNKITISILVIIIVLAGTILFSKKMKIIKDKKQVMNLRRKYC